MAIWDTLTWILEGLYAQVVNIPLDDPLSYLYMMLNILLLLFSSVG